jgi:hypothetical protein
LEEERARKQKELAKVEEQVKALADGLAAAKADAEKQQKEADVKLREQADQHNREVQAAADDRRRMNAALEALARDKEAADNKVAAAAGQKLGTAGHNSRRRERTRKRPKRCSGPGALK